jgi:HlyD family secretion protein
MMPSPSRPLVTRRHLAAALALCLVAAVVTLALRPAALEVETAVAAVGPLRVTLDEEGETRVHDRYVVSAPVAGRVLRVILEPGDRVEAHRTTLATFRPVAAGLLDDRTRSELQARVAAAQAALNAARVDDERARAQRDQAERDWARARQLVAAGAVSREKVEATELALTTWRKTVDRAGAMVRAAEADLRLARASLMTPDREGGGAAIVLRAPIDGVVLRVLRQSEAVVPQGEPILEVGDVAKLEVVADFLSTDAVRIRPGRRALISRWGGTEEFGGRVRLVEPAGFTKVSALGVEEQRVNVIVDIDGPAVSTTRLGDRFRVEVRVVVWEAARVVKVPLGSLVRDGDQWSVFVLREGRAVQTRVDVGQRNEVDAEIRSGVSAGTTVVAFPGSGLADGVRVAPVER